MAKTISLTGMQDFEIKLKANMQHGSDMKYYPWTICVEARATGDKNILLDSYTLPLGTGQASLFSTDDLGTQLKTIGFDKFMDVIKLYYSDRLDINITTITLKELSEL